MAYYQQNNQNPNQYGAQNLQFFPSQYGNPVSGHSTPAQAQYGGASGYGQSSGGSYGGYGNAGAFMSTSPGFGGVGSVSGRMGEQGGLRTGWLAAFGTEGYEGEPPLLEELGVNFGHIKIKAGFSYDLYDTWLTKITDTYRAEPICSHRPAYHG
jgi:protein YIPF5/7